MTWESRDLPVLQAIVDLADENGGRVDWTEVVERTGFERADVQKALIALEGEQPPFFDTTNSAGSLSGPKIELVHSVTGHARRTVGTWPTAEGLAKQIIAGLEEAAAAEPDEEKRSRIKQTAAWLGNTGWSVLLGVAGNAVSKGVGL
ncbi:hypothetical protein ACFXJ8_11795 [Nonomuraea sp. NPDC059194]|uniref:hypothetical protein n=1 Tax=Nonomuraea sp. NPDC059194 TaxID=3346764 RepID=UPI003677355D